MIHISLPLEMAVKDQINAGIDIISDGQVRGDMIEVFAETYNLVWVLKKGIPRYWVKLRPANHSLGAK